MNPVMVQENLKPDLGLYDLFFLEDFGSVSNCHVGQAGNVSHCHAGRAPKRSSGTGTNP